jgi:hypothetical protein
MHGAVSVFVCMHSKDKSLARSLAVLSDCTLRAFLPSGLVSTLVSSLQKHVCETKLTCHKKLFLRNCVLCNRNMP